MIDTPRLLKFIQKIDELIDLLDSRNELPIHQKINQGYYMQKSEELRILLQQFTEYSNRLERLEIHMHVASSELFSHWRRDVRWLNSQPCPNTKSIL